MKESVNGKILKGVGGLYTVRVTDAHSELCGTDINCRARGSFRHSGISPLPGDDVMLTADKEASENQNGNSTTSGAVITQIFDRRNSLIRPPLSNLDFIFITLAAASPQPLPITTDKLISIAEFNRIEPVIIVTKTDLDSKTADTLFGIYKKSGFHVFTVSRDGENGIRKVKEYINANLPRHTAAFAGASGVGKSTLMNRLFPEMLLKTSEVSRKTERGRHTTRSVELFPVGNGEDCGYIADTPGFSLLDFEHFDFFSKDELTTTMREFADYTSSCRYSDCTHTKEEGCAVLEAVRTGKISQSRHDSFMEMYNELKSRNKWQK